jgi:glucokinase
MGINQRIPGFPIKKNISPASQNSRWLFCPIFPNVAGMSDKLFLGIEIGGTKLQLVLGDDKATILQRQRLAIDPKGGGAGIRKQIEAALPGLLRGRKLAGAGAGFGGPVDHRTGRICCSHQVEGWSEFEFSRWLEPLIQAPVRVDNDANTAALAEAVQGAGKGANPVFYATLGSGVGGGLAVDGMIYHGAIPGEAEIGHVRLDKSGRIVEESCSGWAVDRKVREAIQAHPHGKLHELASKLLTGQARCLAEALAARDPLAEAIVSGTADDLAFALSHVVHLCHPEVIVLGGGLSLVGEPLRGAVAEALPHYCMHAFHPGPKIVLAGLGEDVVPVGALLLAIR